MKIYLNGILETTLETSIVPVLTSSQHLGIAAASNGKESFPGWLNDVRIYDHALSVKEIKELSKGLILHYKFDQGNEIDNQPNIAPFFSCSLDEQNFTPNVTDGEGYWYNAVPTNELKDCLTSLSDGWAHFECNNTTSSTKQLYGITCKDLYNVKKDESYTLMVEIRNANFTGTMGGAFLGLLLRGAKIGGNASQGGFQLLHADISNALVNGACIFYLPITVNGWDHLNTTTKINNFLLALQFNVTKNLSVSYDIRLSMYPGTYSGEYKAFNPLKWGYNKIYDNSGYKYDAIANGNLFLLEDTKKYNNSLQFTAGSYLGLEKVPSIETMKNCTFSFWIKTTPTVTMCLWNTRTKTGDPIALFIMNTKKFRFDDGAQHTFDYIIPTDTWEHYVITRDENNIKLYVNGQLNQSMTSSNFSAMGTKGTIGLSSVNTSTGSGNQFLGYLCDYRLYATALSSEDVLELYHTATSIDNQSNLFCGEAVE